MKKLYYIIFIVLAFMGNNHAHAQNTVFVTQGRIEFERKENLWARIDNLDWDDGDWKELMKKSRPQFKTTYFDLRFNNNKMLYLPGREDEANNNNSDFLGTAEDNTIFTNTEKAESISQKNVFEQTFLIQDSIRQIKWKITNETRTIAGFECRRANALIMDSIYIVAFYTDAIVTPGGPESFTGLPGMILGISIPHEHVTWFATKVYTEPQQEAALAPPTKGKKVNNTSLMQTLQQSMKDWGKEGRQIVKQAVL